MADKVGLRLSVLPLPVKDLMVLDAFAGKGTIWKNIQKKYAGKIKITKIDVEQKTEELLLLGDNLKYLWTLPLGRYDIIDLDAYGVACNQLKILFERKYKGTVFVTFIQTHEGILPYFVLQEIGYSLAMIKKIPSLFCKNGTTKFLHWLQVRGVKHVQLRTCGRKTYLAFGAWVK